MIHETVYAIQITTPGPEGFISPRGQSHEYHDEKNPWDFLLFNRDSGHNTCDLTSSTSACALEISPEAGDVYIYIIYVHFKLLFVALIP